METTGVRHLENLVKLAGEKSSDKRRFLLEGISHLFLSSKDGTSEREAELMGDILLQLVREVEMSVRHDLVERLADVGGAPRDLINTLANDEIEVAAPVLMRSGVLQDGDLIEVVRHRTQEHMLAVARRDAVSENVGDALVDRGGEDVIEALLDNHNALISRRAISYLATESKRVDGYQRPLLTRPDLPHELAYEMFDWVSGALRQHILKTSSIEESLLDDVLDDMKKVALGEGDEERPSLSDAQKLVQRLESAGMLTENFLVQALRDGRIDVFITALARKGNIDLTTARRIFFDRGEEGLAIVCKASGFDRPTFASLLLKRKTDDDGGLLASADLQKLMRLYDTITQRNAQRVLRFWSIRRHEGGAQSSEDGAAGVDQGVAVQRQA